MKSMQIRQAWPSDVQALADAHLDSIRAIGSAFYPLDIVEAWAAAVTPELYVRAMAGGEVFFVAVDTQAPDEVAGFSSHLVAEGRHGVSVYVRGSVSRQGIGSALLREAEAHARARGARVLEIEASLPGVEFYFAQGYESVGPIAVTMSGQQVECVAMRKAL
jgi:GNAT superfamily N-acetyltransferase